MKYETYYKNKENLHDQSPPTMVSQQLGHEISITVMCNISESTWTAYKASTVYMMGNKVFTKEQPTVHCMHYIWKIGFI